MSFGRGAIVVATATEVEEEGEGEVEGDIFRDGLGSSTVFSIVEYLVE